jgi:hypothetical protein
MNFLGKAKRLDDADIPRIAAGIGVGEDEIHAVLDVETSGSGFDHLNRPKMLFEPHIFYRQLEGEERAEAVRLKLAYPRWGTARYPADSYPRLIHAMAISQPAALRSCSWGLGQIMGFNHELAGYPTALAMVLDFLDDEEKHLQAMVRFIKEAGLDDELRRHDWRGFASGYNGPGYAQHGYHTKLAQRFAWWQGKPDTPWTRPAQCDPNENVMVAP